MNESLLIETDEAVAILTINDAPYNPKSLDLMDDLAFKNGGVSIHYLENKLGKKS